MILKKHNFSIRYFFFSILILCFSVSCFEQKEISTIDLSGEWQFKMDSLNKGIAEKWFEQKFAETVRLPGSMAENGKGLEITINSKWTGQVVDSAWYKDEKYAKYRKNGNVKIPFWLQPEKHYIGAAWYQKEIEIPKGWPSKNIELTLERPHWETQVWIDNKFIGKQNSLGTPHKYSLENISSGKHSISIRVDNGIKKVDPGINSHSISDHTQSNWNGIVGKITLAVTSKISFETIKLYPDVENKKVTVITQINNPTGKPQKAKIELQAKPKLENGEPLQSLVYEVEVNPNGQIEMVYPMGDKPLLWDEFTPNLYIMNLSLHSDFGKDDEQITFGIRNFKTSGTRFTINGKPIFLRGTLECAIFPKTGYPSTQVDEWNRILRTVKSHGLNHMRFHSWCPPKAAFVAADELGVYLQVEASSWANTSSSIGDGKPIDKWLYKETQDILDAYGNHPSFVMMAYGNEPNGKHQIKYLSQYITHFKRSDNRRVYTSGAGWPYVKNADFYNNASPRIQGWGQGLNSIINKEAPQTLFDFQHIIKETPMPYISHEIGQWCAYPNLKEISKYTGVLKAKNFEIFKETLEENNIGYLADSLLLASGKLQALCYKADIEAALRTKGFAGFQLLDLHDFPGQGTALVGVLDAFWEEKGYISPEEYNRFCNKTVPLARFKKRVFLNNEILRANIEVAHFGDKPLQSPTISWQLASTSGNVIDKGTFKKANIPLDNGIQLGTVSTDLKNIAAPQKLILTASVADFSNSWDVWVYPSEHEKIKNSEKIKKVHKLDSKTLSYLEKGGTVLIDIDKGSLKPEKGGDVGIGFSSIFWNTAWTRGQKPHTLGVLCNPEHALLREFPTEYHSNWQWWDAMSHSNAIVLDEFPVALKPIVRVIDDWFTNRRLALVFEAKVGKGKLLFSGIDLHTDLDKRPEAKQLLYSIKKYMASTDFNPKETLKAETVTGLFK